jgi:hypothetical protein
VRQYSFHISEVKITAYGLKLSEKLGAETIINNQIISILEAEQIKKSNL